MSVKDKIYPEHIAIVMDGNGRWAKSKMLPRSAGHKAGAETVRRVVKMCGEANIKVLTLFAFSSENWQRPAEEVNFLMSLFLTSLTREAKKLNKNNIKLCVIGDREKLNARLKDKINKVEVLTKDNTGLQLNLAVNYGGRWDVVNAVKQIMNNSDISSDQITEDLISSYLSTADLPDPDLFIRTSGEMRISNFLLWQLSYAELYFTDVAWPEFAEKEFNEALNKFSQRQRRFGMSETQTEKIEC